jgi:hypothetical protein
MSVGSEQYLHFRRKGESLDVLKMWVLEVNDICILEEKVKV